MFMTTNEIYDLKVEFKNIKAPARFELAISCLLDRRFNQLSHGADTAQCDKYAIYVLEQCLRSYNFGSGNVFFILLYDNINSFMLY